MKNENTLKMDRKYLIAQYRTQLSLSRTVPCEMRLDSVEQGPINWAAPRRRPSRFRTAKLEYETAANLDDAVAAAAAGDLAEVRAVHRGRRSTEVSQVEDVDSFTA